MSDEANESDRTGPISDQEAREILSRFNSSHWKNETERARYSIPADPRRDDDIRLGAYIEQTISLRAALSTARRELEEAREALRAIAGQCAAQRDGSSPCDQPQPWDGKIYAKNSWCYKCIARAALADSPATPKEPSR